MHRRRSTVVLSALTSLALAVGLLTACGSDASDDTLVIYNSQHKALTEEWLKQFTAETGIKVEVGARADDMGLANKIVAEGDSSPADVFLTENSPAMSLVESAGLFADISDKTKQQVPAQYRPTSGKWTGVAARETVFIYNKSLLQPDQLPKSMSDLALPEWKGRWGSPRSSADFQAIIAAYLELKGEDATRQWLTAMKANDRLLQNNIVTMQKVNTGEIEGGLIYHYYWVQDQAKTGKDSANTALHYFRNQDPGAFLSLSGAGVLKSSKKQALAQQFLEWLTSKTGQSVLTGTTAAQYPVASGVAAGPGMEPLDKLQAPSVDPSKLDAKKVNELMTEAGLI